ncbi:MAG TPA: hypothetical protein VHV31_09565 [Nitrolancea sp.]|nr:hypothetical protein [Nitrolancea sp.]
MGQNAGSFVHVYARSSRLTAFALILALVLLGAIGTFSQIEAATPPLIPKNASEPMYPNLPGVVDTYPTVVAYVDGHPIWGKLLAIRVAALEQSVDPTVDKSHPERDALHDIIRDQILTEHAQDYGISVSYDEARAEAQREKALVLSNPGARTNTALLAKQLGVSVGDYFDQPTVIAAYRDAMTLSEMQNDILNKTPTARSDDAATEAALDTFADGIHAKVQILISVP